MTSLSLFEKTFDENPILVNMLKYLTINDNKQLSLINKKFYYDRENKKYRIYVVKNNASNIIYKMFQKYKLLIESINKYGQVTKKLNALYYYRYYDKKYINSIYNMNKGSWKKDILDKYKKIQDTTLDLQIKRIYKNNNTTRYDLYVLIKIMDVDDMLSIGW
jgi:hypothetical protein